jgi:hypothetical protein
VIGNVANHSCGFDAADGRVAAAAIVCPWQAWSK